MYSIRALSSSPYMTPRGHSAGEHDVRSQADAALSNIEASRSFFAQYGVGPRDGNEGIGVSLEPSIDNAAYTQAQDGREQLVLGANGSTGEPYAFSKDVVAHEYTHHIVQHKVGLGSSGEAGTVGESLADTFASAIDPESNWMMGSAATPGGLRSMTEPDRLQDAIDTERGLVRRPANIRDKFETDQDNGGVHLNVGIPNKAASVIGQTLGRQKMADIYMDAMDGHLRPDTTIAGLAAATLQSASEIYGADSSATRTVADAWRQVGFQISRR